MCGLCYAVCLVDVGADCIGADYIKADAAKHPGGPLQTTIGRSSLTALLTRCGSPCRLSLTMVLPLYFLSLWFSLCTFSHYGSITMDFSLLLLWISLTVVLLIWISLRVVFSHCGSINMNFSQSSFLSLHLLSLWFPLLSLRERFTLRLILIFSIFIFSITSHALSFSYSTCLCLNLLGCSWVDGSEDGSLLSPQVVCADDWSQQPCSAKLKAVIFWLGALCSLCYAVVYAVTMGIVLYGLKIDGDANMVVAQATVILLTGLLICFLVCIGILLTYHEFSGRTFKSEIEVSGRTFKSEIRPISLALCTFCCLVIGGVIYCILYVVVHSILPALSSNPKISPVDLRHPIDPARPGLYQTHDGIPLQPGWMELVCGITGTMQGIDGKPGGCEGRHGTPYYWQTKTGETNWDPQIKVVNLWSKLQEAAAVVFRVAARFFEPVSSAFGDSLESLFDREQAQKPGGAKPYSVSADEVKGRSNEINKAIIEGNAGPMTAMTADATPNRNVEVSARPVKVPWDERLIYEKDWRIMGNDGVRRPVSREQFEEHLEKKRVAIEESKKSSIEIQLLKEQGMSLGFMGGREVCTLRCCCVGSLTRCCPC